MAFAIGLLVITPIVASLGMVGGFILGALNALIIGSTLYLTEQAVLGARRLQWSDVFSQHGPVFLGGDLHRFYGMGFPSYFLKWACKRIRTSRLLLLPSFF